MRVEEVAAGQLHAQDRLDNVAHRAVVGQTDLLRRVHEVTAAEGEESQKKHGQNIQNISYTVSGRSRAILKEGV